MKKIIIINLFFALTVIAVGFISYQYAENMISYDLKINAVKSDTYTEVSKENYNENINSIPFSKSYTIKLQDGKMVVYDNEYNNVYQAVVEMSAFTTSDIKQLEQDGIKLTAYSDLIELLNYICS